MGKIISCSICLTDIPKASITEASNGKKYLNFVVDEKREVDKYGKTHSVYIQQTKDQREAKEPKSYIGNGKEFVFGNHDKQVDDSANSVQNEGCASSIEESDDLPF